MKTYEKSIKVPDDIQTNNLVYIHKFELVRKKQT